MPLSRPVYGQSVPTDPAYLDGANILAFYFISSLWGVMAFRWVCNTCGELHGRNPTRCRGCGGSIFTPVSQSRIAEYSEKPAEVESMNPDQIVTYGSTPEPEYESSPDVALDGSIQTENGSEPVEPGSENGWLIPWWVVMGVMLLGVSGVLAYFVL